MSKVYDKAVIFIKQGDFKAALKLLDKLIREEPKNPVYYSERGVVYYHLKDKMKSIRDMDRAVDLQPGYSYRYSSRAFIKDWLGDLDGAIEDYEKAVSLDPDDAIAHNNLGMLQEKKGYKQKAQTYYDKADRLAGVSERYKEIKTTTSYESISEEHKKLTIERKASFPAQDVKSPTTKSGVIKKVFSDRKMFKEFMKFILNGFRLKK